MAIIIQKKYIHIKSRNNKRKIKIKITEYNNKENEMKKKKIN